LTMFKPFLLKWWNYVHDPNASPIAIPKTAAIPLDSRRVRFKG
jgi:hypothetical protein